MRAPKYVDNNIISIIRREQDYIKHLNGIKNV